MRELNPELDTGQAYHDGELMPNEYAPRLEVRFAYDERVYNAALKGTCRLSLKDLSSLRPE